MLTNAPECADMRINMPFWWSFVALAALVFGLAGCDSPSPGFAGLPKQQITVNGSRFSVHYSQYQAQAIRLNPEWPPHRTQIMAKAGRAISLASGCAVVPGSLKGDAALIKADLKCSGASEKGRPPKQYGLDCDLTRDWRNDGVGYGAAEVECGVVEL